MQCMCGCGGEGEGEDERVCMRGCVRVGGRVCVDVDMGGMRSLGVPNMCPWWGQGSWDGSGFMLRRKRRRNGPGQVLLHRGSRAKKSPINFGALFDHQKKFGKFSGFFPAQDSSGFSMFVNRVHVSLSLPHRVSSTPPCRTSIESTAHVLPIHVYGWGVGVVLWVGGGGEREGQRLPRLR